MPSVRLFKVILGNENGRCYEPDGSLADKTTKFRRRSVAMAWRITSKTAYLGRGMSMF